MARLTLDETMNRLLLLIRAGYPVIYIVSHEEARVLDYLVKIVRVIRKDNPTKQLYRWYDGIGHQRLTSRLDDAEAPGHGAGEDSPRSGWLEIQGLPDAASWDVGRTSLAWDVLNSIRSANINSNPNLADSMTVFFDLHLHLLTSTQTGQSGSLVRPLRNAADELRRYYDAERKEAGRYYKTIVVVAPTAAGLSLELERDIIVLDFPLPEIDELRSTLEVMVDQKWLRFPEQDADARSPETDRSRLCDLIAGAGRGLTLEDYKRGLNMFAVQEEHLDERRIDDMLHLKAKAINSQALEYTPNVQIHLGGLKLVKEWIEIRRKPSVSESLRERYHLPAPKGVMLCGVSGGGKSQLAKLIAKEFNLALLRLDVGALFGMYVGESEERTRKALQLAEVLAPIVLWIDEIDKAFSGVGDGADNGVSTRIFGHFLTWLSEKEDSVFVVTTANDFRTLLGRFPEFGRKGRFDEIFWVGLPERPARQAIFLVYLKKLLDRDFLELRPSTTELRRKYGIPEELPDERALQQWREEQEIPDELAGPEELERLCWLLSHASISSNMTGAEIENAVNEALYRSYERNQRDPTSTLTAEIVIEAVQSSANRALYFTDGPDHIEMMNLQNDAAAKNWILVGQQN